MLASVRKAAVAGTFYPGSAEKLKEAVRRLLAEAAGTSEAALPVPKALIVPHAGYIYSGPIAASAYSTLAPARGRIRRVVILGPSHRVYVRGLAFPQDTEFETPLGRLTVSEEARRTLGDYAQVSVADEAHRREHSLEVQLPFLQALFDRVEIVPLAVGEAPANEIAEVLGALWGADDTIILISSDLSHYLPYDEAVKKDRAAVDNILVLEPLGYDGACGAAPINGLLAAARRRGLSARLLDLRNSGDTEGDKSRVVGYAAVAFQEKGR